MQPSPLSTSRTGSPPGSAGTFHIRRVTPDDAGDIAMIRVRGWQTAYWGQLDDALLDGLSAEADAERWRAHLAAPPPRWHGFIAQRNGDAVGFVTGGPSRDAAARPAVAEIYAIYVRPEDIGTGCGRSLLDRAVAVLAADGHQELIFWVLDTNTSAQRFYRRAGFEPDGASKRDELDGFPVDEIRLRRRIR